VLSAALSVHQRGGRAGEVVAPQVRRGMSMARSVYLSVLDRTERLVLASGDAPWYERGPDLVIFEGSGAAFPPIATARRILVANSSIEPELLTGYLNTYRVLVSDLRPEPRSANSTIAPSRIGTAVSAAW
jgi:predicted GTPase